MKRLLITGANGQLGNCLRRLLAERTEMLALFTDVDNLDLTDAEAVADCVAEFRPDYIVNCAAYTAVDRAENDEPVARKVNVDAVKNLAAAALKQGARVVHISTDYVFAGDLPRPLTEEDEPAPNTAYGRTKLAGEKALLEVLAGNSVILRTAWLYSPFGNNFVKTMLRLSAERKELRVVADQIGTPTSAFTLAAAIMAVIDAEEWKPGVYHLTDEGVASWYDLAVETLRLAGRGNCTVTPVGTEDYPAVAKRPMYSLLSKEKFSKTFHYPLPYWRDALKPVIEELCECSD